MEIQLPEDILAEGVVKDNLGDYWAGNAATLLRFHPDGVPPDTRIAGRVTNILEGGRMTVRIDASERFRPTGRRDDYSLSWRVDDREWSPFQQGLGDEISIPELDPGTHSIAVRS